MNKLFKLAQAKGKWHKFPFFNLKNGTKLYKNFTQKLLAVSLCMAVVLLGTPVTTFADPHAHTTEYSGTKGDDDYCLVCDVATKVNNLYRDSVDEITVENAAKVISQIHAIDQIKFELDDAQYEELIKLTDGWSEGEYGELPSKYFKAKEKIDELGLNGGWLAVEKNVLGVGGGWALDLSEAKVSLEVTPVEAAADGTYVAKSDAETMNLDMYGMYDNFSMLLNEATPDFRGQRSFYKRYDVNAGVIDNVNNNGWTTSFLLPAGTYRIREVNREAPMIVDGEEFHTGSTTYTYNGASTTSVVGEDDPGVVVQVPAGAVTPVTLWNVPTGSLAVSYTVDSPLESDKEREFTFTVTLDDTTINGTYGDMTFKNGVAAFTLMDGESIIAGGLPDGTGYTVTSAVADGFTVTPEIAEGTIDPGSEHEAKFTFTRSVTPLTLTVTCAGLPSTGSATAVWHDSDQSDTLSSANAFRSSFDVYAAGTYTCIVSHSLPGYSPTASVVTFEVTESESGGRLVCDSPSVTVSFARETGDLEVAVAFESRLSQLPSFSEGKVTVMADDFPDLSGTFGDLTFVDGSAAFDYPGAGDFDLSATGLPVGTYTVIADGFAADGLSVDTTYSVNGGSVVLASGETAAVVVTNTISAASPVADCFSTLPAALSDLTFNKDPQTLISAGTLNAAFSGCHVEYAVVETCPAEDSAFWSTSLPMGTGAGTYKVWYRVVDSTSKAVLGVSEEAILVTIAPRSLTEAAVGFAGGPHYYTGSEVTPPVSVSLTGFGLLTDGTDYVVSYSNNTNAGTATVTITGRGDFTGTVSETFTITKATPDSSGLTTSLDAFCGQTLGELLGRLAKPKDLKGNTLEGSWSWADKDGKPLSDDTKVGSVGEHTFTALFAPEDTNNYAWTSLAGWDADKGALVVVVTVKVSVDTSKWGDAHERPGDKKTQYVDLAGKTSIEVKADNLSAGSVLWLFEESYGTSAWYGIDLSAGAFALDKGLRFYVQWVSPNDAEYDTHYSKLDKAQKARVEGDNGWIFLIGVEDPDGNKIQPAQPVNVYVQLGKDWDPEHLNAYYISTGADVGVPIKNLILYFPGGSGIFGCMTLSHFSPYFIFDELTDEEKAALNSGNVKTGDIATQITVAGLGMTLVLALGIMLRLITGKKKFEE